MPSTAKPKRPDVRSPYVFDVREFGRRPGAMRQFDRDVTAHTLLSGDDTSLDALYTAEGADLLLDLRLESVVEGVLATGRVSGSLVAECVRCLDPVEAEVDADFQELYYYDLEDLSAEELEEALSVVEELVDVETLVRDAVRLDLPLQPLCEPDCPGLCPECGAKLAEDPGHGHESTDPRWAALSALVPDADKAEKEA
jgi:uncharacterized protein